MATIALKVDVETWRGTCEGVPALMHLLERFDAPATFLFSLGPDHSGRALKRLFRPGFFGKVARTSALGHYGLKTLLYGTLLPGPDIGKREVATLRAVEQAGFETGVHSWDHVRWQDGVATANEAWTRRELERATARYADIFGHTPAVHGAAGWQMNEAAYRIEGELGYSVASDTRGDSPFLPVDAHGQRIGPPQFPTTLPTLDELLGVDGWDASNVHLAIQQHSDNGAEVQVYTLRAELEGQKLLPTFEQLLHVWRDQGHQFATLGELPKLVDISNLPRRRPGMGTVPGRSGQLAVAGPAAQPATS